MREYSSHEVKNCVHLNSNLVFSEIFCKVENCLVCAATKCQQCETSYVLGADGLCVTKDTTPTDSTTSSRDDSTREGGSEPGLTALEIAGLLKQIVAMCIYVLVCLYD